MRSLFSLIRKTWSVPCFFSLIVSLTSTTVGAATYSVPAALGSGIFSSCSAITYVCGSSISVGNNDTVDFTAPMTLSINGDFTVGNNSVVSNNGNAITIAATGNISIGNSILSSINFTAGGNFTAGNAGSISGDITASGTLTLGTTTVTGYCTPSNAQCSNGVTGGCTSSTSGYVTTVTCTSDGTFRPPSNVTLAQVEAWGGGGGGGAATGNPDKGGGGAGGQYAYKITAVTSSTTYSVVVGGAGAGGSSSAGVAGGDSTFNTNTVVAKGGAGGGYAGTNGGDGAAAAGAVTGGIGDLVYRGGNSTAGNSSGSDCNNGGAGGGGAGSGGNGGNASGNTAGTGTATGGGNGGAGRNDSGTGNVGSTYGGGGGGACAESNTNRTGGAGGAGRVVITYSATPTPLADWRMDEASWNGTANEVLDSSGNNNHGRARIANGATALPTTASGTPAYTIGGNSTCYYGQFDTAAGTTRTYTYVELSNMPALPTSFTFAAWIRSTSPSAQHQRILVRDDADNGWGLSLADGTGQAKLRFFNRNITNSGTVSGQGSNPGCGVFCLDTDAVVTANNWHYIAASIDTVGKTITLYVYNASGTLLAKTSSAFSGTWADGTGTAAIGGETSASSEGQQTSWHFLGNIDEVQVYSGVLAQATIQTLLTRVRTCPTSAPNHIRIEHDGSAIACAAESVTLRACANASCSTYYTGGVTGNLTAGSNTVAFSIPAGSSSTTASIHLPTNSAAADPQTVRLAASSITPTPADSALLYCDKPSTATNNNTTDCDVSVSKAGFLFDVPDLTAGTASGTVNIRAVTSTDSSNCTPLFQSKTRDVALWGSYQNPATGTLSVRVNGSNIETTASPAYTSTYSLAFDATGTASLTSVRYDDAGQMQLGARYVGSTANTPPDGGMIVTGADSFVVKPASFSLVATCVDSTVNAANQTTPSASDPKFCRAGKTFSVVATARNALNNATPNFGKETTPETVGITWSRELPATGANGTLPSGSPTYTGSGGVFGTAGTYSWTWDEVGILKAVVAVGDADYLGAGNASSTAYVGRFYPDHFRVDITPQCGGFVYGGHAGAPVATGQPFSVKATARNGKATPTATTNYTNAGGFASAVNLTLSAGGTVGKLYVDATQGGTGAIPAANFVSNGEGEVLYSAGSGKISYVFDGATTAPTTVTIHADNADTATSTGTDGSTQARTGRLRLLNAFGSEKLALKMDTLLEYYNGTQWVSNTDDSCTPLSSLSGPTAALTVGTGNTTPRCNVAANTCSAASGVACNAAGTISSGSAGLCLTAPGAVGQTDITFAPAAYLQHSSGSLTGRAGFGLYNQSGNSKRIIYRREVR